MKVRHRAAERAGLEGRSLDPHTDAKTSQIATGAVDEVSADSPPDALYWYDTTHSCTHVYTMYTCTQLNSFQRHFQRCPHYHSLLAPNRYLSGTACTGYRKAHQQT